MRHPRSHLSAVNFSTATNRRGTLVSGEFDRQVTEDGVAGDVLGLLHLHVGQQRVDFVLVKSDGEQAPARFEPLADGCGTGAQAAEERPVNAGYSYELFQDRYNVMARNSPSWLSRTAMNPPLSQKAVVLASRGT